MNNLRIYQGHFCRSNIRHNHISFLPFLLSFSLSFFFIVPNETCDCIEYVHQEVPLRSCEHNLIVNARTATSRHVIPQLAVVDSSLL